MNKQYYIRLRDAYRPANIKTVFVLESPPISGKYFYNPDGLMTELLFSAMMKLLKVEPKTKPAGLEYFSRSGHFLVDASYKPVNHLKGKVRNNTILESYEDLVEDLRSLGDSKAIKFILVKANICRLLEPRLLAEGINVVNNGIVIPFPSWGQRRNFHKMAPKVFRK